MSIFLKQSTSIDVRLGPFVDVGDGFTPETGVTIAASDEAEILKANGAATVAMAGTFAAVTGCDGWYDYTLSTSDTDTVGELVIVMQDDSVYLPVFMRFYVVEEAVYDAMYAASAEGPLQGTTAGNTLDVNATGEAGIDLDNTSGTLAKTTDITGFNDLSAAQVNTEVDTALTDIHLDHLFQTDYDPAAKPGTATALLNELVESDAGVSRFTTNALEQVWNAATRILTASTNFNDLSAAEVNAEVDTALTDIHLDHLFQTDYDPAAKPGVATALLNELVESDGGVSRFTANAIENWVKGTLTIVEPSAGAPSATPDFEEWAGVMWSLVRNKVTVTATLLSAFNDAGTNIFKATLSDDGTTFTRQELVAP